MTIEPVNIWRTDTYTGPKGVQKKIYIGQNQQQYIYIYVYTGRETFLERYAQQKGIII